MIKRGVFNMIDPDNIILAKKNEVSTITLPDIPEFDGFIWDLDDPKDMKKFLSTIEKEVRQSFEYREMIHFIKNNYDMDQCAFIQYDPSDTYNISIEIHHYPFTLFDITVIVYKKRVYYGEAIETRMIAKEVTMLHYKLLVGLIPLSKTVHQLVHDSKLFIPVGNVFGNYRKFVDTYKAFCDEEQLETLDRIEKYSLEQSHLNDTTILDRNNISYNITNDHYRLPNLSIMEDKMVAKTIEIKKNGYRLPTLEDYQNSSRDSFEDRFSIDSNLVIDVLDFRSKNGIEVLDFVKK